MESNLYHVVSICLNQFDYVYVVLCINCVLYCQILVQVRVPCSHISCSFVSNNRFYLYFYVILQIFYQIAIFGGFIYCLFITVNTWIDQFDPQLTFLYLFALFPGILLVQAKQTARRIEYVRWPRKKYYGFAVGISYSLQIGKNGCLPRKL